VFCRGEFASLPFALQCYVRKLFIFGKVLGG
jgi:hypothetical protein